MTSGVVNSSLDAAIASTRPTASVYRWQQPVEGDWQSPSNWSPPRISPSDDDALVFDLGGTVTATKVPTQTIGQLILSQNTTVSLQSDRTVGLAISGGDGHDLIVAPNSALNFNAINPIALNLVTGATGSISGSMTFSSPGLVEPRLTAADAGAVSFNEGSVFTAGPGFTGNPFGITSLNSVIFKSGSTYICMAEGDPFGAVEPDSVVAFRKGSLFSVQGAVTPSFSGRTYANFELNYVGADLAVTGTSAVVMDDVTLRAGRLEFRLTGNPGHAVKGDIFCFSGTILRFSTGTLRFDGPDTQTLTRQPNTQQGVSGAFSLIIDNPMGIVVNDGMAAGNLELVNGVVTVDPTWVFGILGSVTRTNGYINGRVQRLILTPGTFEFYVGTENGYAPVTAYITAGDFPTAFDVRPVQGPQPNLLDPSRALSRYWRVFENSGNITADLTFHYLESDIPETANEADLVIFRFDGTNFVQIGGVIDTAANTFTITGVTDFARDWTLAEPGALVAPRLAPFDYDSDGRTDFSVFRPSEGAWYLQKSTEGFLGMLFGFGSDKITPADFDGDGKTDIAVFRPSDTRWYIFNSANGTYSTHVFGLAEDVPAPADYDGDGRADLCMFRPSDGTWYIQYAAGGFFARQFGASADKPTVGDFDGDGRSDLAVFRTTNGEWYQVHSSDNSIHGEQFGFSSDKLAYADYDGDGKTDLAIFRPSERVFYIKNSQTSTYTAFVFGLPDDIPTPGDYDGDGKADLSVFRPSDGNWYRQNSGNGSYTAFNFGLSGDRPTPTAYH